MTIIDTTLYANGALRLSRHGAGKGDTVLVHVPSARQTIFVDEDTEHVISYLVYELVNRHRVSASAVENIFDEVSDRLGG